MIITILQETLHNTLLLQHFEEKTI